MRDALFEKLTEQEVGPKKLLVANIRLFANLGGAVHQVGVGWL